MGDIVVADNVLARAPATSGAAVNDADPAEEALPGWRWIDDI